MILYPNNTIFETQLSIFTYKPRLYFAIYLRRKCSCKFINNMEYSTVAHLIAL